MIGLTKALYIRDRFQGLVLCDTYSNYASGEDRKLLSNWQASVFRGDCAIHHPEQSWSHLVISEFTRSEDGEIEYYKLHAQAAVESPQYYRHTQRLYWRHRSAWRGRVAPARRHGGATNQMFPR